MLALMRTTKKEPEMAESWRDYSGYFVEIGRRLEAIEVGLRRIRATGTVDDAGANSAAYDVYSAARRLLAAADSLRRHVEGG